MCRDFKNLFSLGIVLRSYAACRAARFLDFWPLLMFLADDAVNCFWA